MDSVLSVIAYLIGFGMIGGALAGWLTTIVLIANELITPRIRELREPRRERPQPSRAAPGL